MPLGDEIGLPGEPDTVGFKMREEHRRGLFAGSLTGRGRRRWRGLLRPADTGSEQGQQREQDATPWNGTRDGILLTQFEARTKFTKTAGKPWRAADCS